LETKVLLLQLLLVLVAAVFPSSSFALSLFIQTLSSFLARKPAVLKLPHVAG